MNFQLKKYAPALPAFLLSAALPCAAWALSDDYGLRTLNSGLTAEQLAQKPVDGYNYVFTSAFVTKGAWGYDNLSDFSKLTSVLKRAEKEDQLTTEGVALYAAIKRLEPKIRKYSYSDLTVAGINAVNELGAGYGETRRNLMASHKMYDNSIDILFAYDGNDVSLKTGEQFVLGLIRSFENDRIQIEYAQDESADLAYYESLDYRRWLSSYPDTRVKLGQIKYGVSADGQSKSNQTRNYVDNVLQRIFKKKFITVINHNSLILDSRIEARDIVGYLFDFYKYLPSLSVEDADEFAPFMGEVMRDDEKRFFSAVDNATNFIRYGPSVAGQTQTEEPGRKIFADLAATITEYRESSDEQVKFYFVDPRAMLSLLTLLEGEGLDKPLAGPETYSYNRDSFKVSRLTPLNTIVIWDFYRNSDGEIVVRINHNGEPLRIRETCPAAVADYYRWDALAECFAGAGE